MVPKMLATNPKGKSPHVLSDDDFNHGHEVTRRENVGISSLNMSTRESSFSVPRFLVDFSDRLDAEADCVSAVKGAIEIISSETTLKLKF